MLPQVPPSIANFIVCKMKIERLTSWKSLYPKFAYCLTSTQIAIYFSAQKPASDQKEKPCWDVLRIKVSCGEVFMLNSFSAQRGVTIDM